MKDDFPSDAKKRGEVMDGLNKTNCAFALDGTCKLDENACKPCKVDMETSEFHKTLICGLTWDELMEMQRGEKKESEVKE